MKSRSIFAFLLGVGVGAAGAFYFAHKRMIEELEAEHAKKEEYAALSASSDKPIEEPEGFEVADIPEEEEESPEELIIKNEVLTETLEKPDIFDYARISLNKKNDKITEISHDPIEDGLSADINSTFKMRKIDVSEFEELAYSYEMEELTLYQDGIVTDYKEEPKFKLKDMYSNASLDDQDETGHIYVAADYNMTVYDITEVALNYKDVYPEEEMD